MSDTNITMNTESNNVSGQDFLLDLLNRYQITQLAYEQLDNDQHLVVIYYDKNDEMWTIHNSQSNVYIIDDSKWAKQRIIVSKSDTSNRTIKDLFDGKEIDFSAEWGTPDEDASTNTGTQG
jgi:hypothetical protein